ncbi:hypothetical protein MPSEU_000668700 [Mayamaea pseudoterrestris]|nr:hypothetical protein MPSEU_000668700 [Mayamaea pseudoterrestris]
MNNLLVVSSLLLALLSQQQGILVYAQQVSSSSTTTTTTIASNNVIIDEPVIWKLYLFGSNCTVTENLDLIQEELLVAMQAQAPDAVFLPPGGTSSGSNRNLGIALCPSRTYCQKPANVQWCRFLGCYCTNCGGRRRSLAESEEKATASTTSMTSDQSSTNLRQRNLASNKFLVSKTEWSWNKASLDTWTDYSKEERMFDSLVASDTVHPANYITAVKEMNLVLTSIAPSYTAATTTSKTVSATCSLGARLSASA